MVIRKYLSPKSNLQSQENRVETDIKYNGSLSVQKISISPVCLLMRVACHPAIKHTR